MPACAAGERGGDDDVGEHRQGRPRQRRHQARRVGALAQDHALGQHRAAGRGHPPAAADAREPRWRACPRRSCAPSPSAAARIAAAQRQRVEVEALGVEHAVPVARRRVVARAAARATRTRVACRSGRCSSRPRPAGRPRRRTRRRRRTPAPGRRGSRAARSARASAHGLAAEPHQRAARRSRPTARSSSRVEAANPAETMPPLRPEAPAPTGRASSSDRRAAALGQRQRGGEAGEAAADDRGLGLDACQRAPDAAEPSGRVA